MKNWFALALVLCASVATALPRETEQRLQQLLVDHPAELLAHLPKPEQRLTRLELAEYGLFESEAMQLLARGEEGYQAATRSLQQLQDRRSPLAVRLMFSQTLNLDHLGRQEHAFKILDELQNDPSVLRSEALRREYRFVRAVLLTSIDRSADALELLLPLQEQSDNESRRPSGSDIANAIGNAYASSGNLHNALRYYLDAHSLAQSEQARMLQNIAAYNLGITYWDMRDPRLAKRFFEESLALSLTLDDQQGIAYLQQVLAEVAISEQQFVEAKQYLDAAADGFQRSQNPFMVNRVIITRAELAMARQQFAQAHQLLDLAETEADKLNKPRLLEDVYLLRAEVFAEQGQFEQALQSHQQYHRSVMGALSTDQRMRTDELRIKFETERKDRENQILQQQTELQQALLTKQRQTMALVLTVTLLLMTWVAFLIYHAHKNKKLRQHLDQLAYTDELTGMANRRHVLDLLHKERERVHRYHRPSAIALIDIDHFKLINDVHGHVQGDAVLKHFTGLCANVLRSTDTIGRFGGEEFLLILPETTLHDAQVLLERLRQAVQHHQFPDLPADFRVTISIGVTSLDLLDITPEESLKRADDAVYEAKRTGRNRIIVQSREQALLRIEQEREKRSFELL